MHTLENRFLHSNGFCMGISGGGHDGLIRVMAANNKNKGLERMNESKPLVFIGIIFPAVFPSCIFDCISLDIETGPRNQFLLSPANAGPHINSSTFSTGD
jgi:hypothetical protein